MIHGDRGDHGRQWHIHHIGGIKPAAQANFQQQNIGLVFGKQFEGNGCGDFKLGNLGSVIDALDFQHRGNQRGIVDKPPTLWLSQPDTLVKPHQMWRSVDMDLFSIGFEQAAHIRRGRAFAVGSCNMDGWRQALFRMAELFQQRFQTTQRQVHQARVQPGQPL